MPIGACERGGLVERGRVVDVLDVVVLGYDPDFALFFGTTRRPAFAVIGRITL